MSEEPVQPENEPPSKRRWCQYSIRSLMLVTLVIACWLGYISHNARKQRDIVAWVKEMEGSVEYDYQFDAKGGRIEDAQPPGPDWLREWIGIEYFSDVTLVNLENSQVKDLSPLTGLTNLKKLWLGNTQVSDLSPLKGLTNLVFLYLSDTEVRDLSPLEDLTILNILFLSETQVTDLSPLEGLRNLEYLNLEGTPVSWEEGQKLQKLLPKCDIDWDGRIYLRSRPLESNFPSLSPTPLPSQQ